VKKYKNAFMRNIYETALGFYKAGGITAEQMKEFDDCLVHKGESPVSGGTAPRAASPAPVYAGSAGAVPAHV